MTPDRGGRCATGASDTGYRYRRPERCAFPHRWRPAPCR